MVILHARTPVARCNASMVVEALICKITGRREGGGACGKRPSASDCGLDVIFRLPKRGVRGEARSQLVHGKVLSARHWSTHWHHEQMGSASFRYVCILR